MNMVARLLDHAAEREGLHLFGLRQGDRILELVAAATLARKFERQHRRRAVADPDTDGSGRPGREIELADTDFRFDKIAPASVRDEEFAFDFLGHEWSLEPPA